MRATNVPVILLMTQWIEHRHLTEYQAIRDFGAAHIIANTSPNTNYGIRVFAAPYNCNLQKNIKNRCPWILVQTLLTLEQFSLFETDLQTCAEIFECSVCVAQCL